MKNRIEVMRVRRVETFEGEEAEEALRFLARHEAMNCFLYGVLCTLRRNPTAYSETERPSLLCVESERGRVCVVVHTPPCPLAVSICEHVENEALIEQLAETLAPVVVECRAAQVDGPDDVVAALLRRLSGRVEFGMGVYECRAEQLVSDAAVAPMRLATAEDADLVQDFGAQFLVDIGEPGRENLFRKQLLSGERRYFFDSDGVCMVGLSGKTPNGIRVGPVFTLASHRKQGRAQLLVGQVTRLCFEEGNELVFLFTDSDNDTSNGVYKRLGFVMVGTRTRAQLSD
jgi:predicted GNAT family acetyltransferase